MKRIYLSPLTEVFKVETITMIASTTLNPSDTSPSVEVSSESYEGTFSSRESYDDWD